MSNEEKQKESLEEELIRREGKREGEEWRKDTRTVEGV